MFAALLQWPGVKAWLGQFPETRRKMLVIAHREELLDQAAEKIYKQNPGLVISVEQGARYASRYSDVVIASIQTLSARKFHRLKRLLRQHVFRIVIVDEAHHAAAVTYRTALAHLGFLPSTAIAAGGDEIEAATFDDVKVMEQALEGWDARAPKDRLLIGVTATPNRTDAIGLGCVFQTIAYSYALKAAIDDKWLVPIKPWVIETTTSLDNVKMSHGDFNQRYLAETVNTEKRNQLAVAAWQEHGADRSTLAFTVDVAHAGSLAWQFQQAGVNAKALSGETPKDERRQMLAGFKAGRVKLIANCMVLTEGVALPMASCILHAKPTKSATLYEQMCLDAETEILGEQGWIGINDAITGRVAAFSLLDSAVRWSDATRIERPRGREQMWGVETPHLSLRVTGGHRMVTRTRSESYWRIRSAEALPQEIKIPLCGTENRADADIEDVDLTFLGLVLTDGNYNRRNGQIQIFQSEIYPEVIGLIRGALRMQGVKYGHRVITADSPFGPRSPLHCWWISRGAPRGRDSHLRGWGYLKDWISETGKSLTPAYERLSRRQFGVLLSAMHAGDGVKSLVDYERQSLSICGNHALCDQVQSLAVRRGYRCNKARRTDRLAMLHLSADRPDWTIQSSASDDRPAWAVLPSDPDERVWCVSVDTGAIIIRRHGKVAVVGNTGRGLRIHPGKTDCVVIDVVDVARRHSLQAAAVLYGLPPGLVIKGKTLDETQAEYEQFIEEHPQFDIEGALANGHATLAQLGAQAATFDIWKIPSLGAFGAGRAFDWIKFGEDSYRLVYPWADGIETLTVSKDVLGHWDLSCTLRSRTGGARQRTIAQQVDSANAAAGLAEAFVLAERRSVTKLKERDAPWRKKPASDSQMALLRRFGVPHDPQRLTMGEASNLIDLAQARRGR